MTERDSFASQIMKYDTILLILNPIQIGVLITTLVSGIYVTAYPESAKFITKGIPIFEAIVSNINTKEEWLKVILFEIIVLSVPIGVLTQQILKMQKQLYESDSENN